MIYTCWCFLTSCEITTAVDRSKWELLWLKSNSVKSSLQSTGELVAFCGIAPGIQCVTFSVNLQSNLLHNTLQGDRCVPLRLSHCALHWIHMATRPALCTRICQGAVIFWRRMKNWLIPLSQSMLTDCLAASNFHTQWKISLDCHVIMKAHLLCLQDIRSMILREGICLWLLEISLRTHLFYFSHFSGGAKLWIASAL